MTRPANHQALLAKRSAAGSNVPAGDAYVAGPDPGTPGPFAIKCSYCTTVSKTKSDFYRHLSEKHFKAELARELPTAPPFKCPVQACTYESKDNSVSPLVKHYGIVHKAVYKFLEGQIAGRWIHHDPRKPVETHMNSADPGMVNGGGQPLPQQSAVQTFSNEALKIQCPFCESMFAARYLFFQHLCDRHFKEPLAAQLPANPPWACPVAGCGYVARDSRQVNIFLEITMSQAWKLDQVWDM